MRSRVFVVLAVAAFVACKGEDDGKPPGAGGGAASGGKGGSGGKAGGGTAAAGDAGSANAGEGGESVSSGGESGVGGDAPAGAAGEPNGGDTSSGGTPGNAGAGGEAGAGGNGDPGITQCADLAPLGSGTCLVTAGDEGKLISGNILLPGQVLRGGQVLVNGAGVIVCADCDCSNAAGANTATTIVCPQGVVSPGLISAHDHLSYTQNGPYVFGSERYEGLHDWRIGNDSHTVIPTTGGATEAQKQWGELRFVLTGATSIVGTGNADGLLRNLDGADDRQEGLGQQPVDGNSLPFGPSGTEIVGNCDYVVSDDEQTVADASAYLPVTAEGIDAASHNEFSCMSSATYDVTGPTVSHQLLEPQSAFVQNIALTAADWALMATQRSSLIWSPRSNIALYGNTAAVTLAARSGVRIALGNTWTITGSMNLLRELQCADSFNQSYLDGFFDDEDLWRMVTLNAAEATATLDVIGVLSPGRVADISIFDGSVHADHRAVIEGAAPSVALVLRGGKALYGDDAVVQALPDSPGCDAVDICGVDKRVCLQSEIGTSYAALSTAVASSYPAWFCSTPNDEPTCTPSRGASVSGSTTYTGELTAADLDGDGMSNAADNCPTVFNPVRPMDTGAQPDADSDALGDACDPCPLTANTSCTVPDPDDHDGDGVLNWLDNCSAISNANQADLDGDDKGDACDPCPDGWNAGVMACPTSIYEIKQGIVAASDPAVLGNVLVTAANDAGFYVQVKASDANYEGPNFSGVFVFAPNSGVVAGDRVSVTGTVNDFFGQIEVVADDVSVVSSLGEAPPAAVIVDAASEIALGGGLADDFEGVIVELAGLIVTDDAPLPGPGDSAPTGEFVVDDLLRVNDYFYAITPLPAVTTPIDLLRGVLHYANNEYKIEPRGAADIQYGSGHLVINEVDYDNPSTDTMEFVEIYNPMGAGENLSGYSLVLVGGADNQEYLRMPLSGTLPAGGYLVIGTQALLDTVVADLELAFALTSNNVQNGSPDGIALVDALGVVDALSYEGEMQSANLLGLGATSLVEGTAFAGADTEVSGVSLVRLPNGMDRNNASLDWAVASALTPGASND